MERHSKFRSVQRATDLIIRYLPGFANNIRQPVLFEERHGTDRLGTRGVQLCRRFQLPGEGLPASRTYALWTGHEDRPACETRRKRGQVVALAPGRVQVPNVAGVRAAPEVLGKRKEVEEVVCGTPRAGEMENDLVAVRQAVRARLGSADGLGPHDAVGHAPARPPRGDLEERRDPHEEAAPVGVAEVDEDRGMRLQNAVPALQRRGEVTTRSTLSAGRNERSLASPSCHCGG